jgi:hypothetical protein
VGDGDLEAYDDATRGRFPEEDCHVQCAVLGSGMFDYEHSLSSSSEYTRMKAYVKAVSEATWEMQGALATIKSSNSAPTLFFYNTDDFYKDDNKDPKGLYATQAALMKAKLDAVGTPTEVLEGYSSGHAVPQTITALTTMYAFLFKHVNTTLDTGISTLKASTVKSHDDATYNIAGCRVDTDYKGLVITSQGIKLRR